MSGIYGTDIAHVGNFIRTPAGDLGTITGILNVKNALFHRLITVPGSLAHRPTYGVGLPLFLNGLSSFSKQQQLATRIQEQFSLDPRVAEVTSIGVDNDDTNPQQTVIRVFVRLVGYTDAVAMDFTAMGVVL